MNSITWCLIFILSTISALRIMYKLGKDAQNLEILNGLEPIVDSQGEWKDAKDDPYQNGYFQGREDALQEVLDLFGTEEVSENE